MSSPSPPAPPYTADRATRELIAVTREAVKWTGTWRAVRGASPKGPDEEIRVAHLALSFKVGGLERVVQALCRAGRKYGVKSTVIAYGEDGELREGLPREGTDTVFFPTEPGVSPALGFKIAQELVARRIHVLHSHHMGPFVYGALASRLANVCHVYTEHSREMYDAPRRELIGRTMRHFAHTVCVSNELALWRRENLGDDPEYVPNGVAVGPEPSPAARRAIRAELGLRDGFVAGCVARLAPEKDHITLVDAFRIVANVDPSAQLVIVGTGAEERRIAAHVEALGLSGNVIMLGSRSDAERLMVAYDVIALSSRREGLPLALLEGMAAGAPVVATDVGEVRKLTSGGCGQIVPPGDAAALADALLVYARDPVRRAADGIRARERVVAGYSADAMARRYVQIYRALARFGDVPDI
ncbi:MAG: glycosyltransferase [Myxococcales bacterium]|nr:glycosyltransferase [Myxococcales bacterium]MCB9530201.1 glycosyltransferase [Myxococcales bacterium]MCB9533714.1 glycosyltransferase [Myxococcales bacterium]